MIKRSRFKFLSVFISVTMAVSPLQAMSVLAAQGSDDAAFAVGSVGLDDSLMEGAYTEDTESIEVSGVEEEVQIPEETENLTEETLICEEEILGDESFTTVGGGFETIYATIAGVKDNAVTKVSYNDGTNAIELSGNDFDYLVREDYDGNVRVDIPGVKPGTYSLTIVAGSKTYTKSGIKVSAYDRSGFAHFNYDEGVGAYNDDGTIKDKALVLYVDDSNKNKVQIIYDTNTKTATVNNEGTAVAADGKVIVTGIGNILNSTGQECSDAGHEGQCKMTPDGKATYGTANGNKGIIKLLASAGIPLDVRLIGAVSETGLGKKGTYDAADDGKIDGLTAYDSVDYGGSAGDNGHMARMKSGKDVTIEGIGTDAMMDGWGVHFMCESSATDLGKSFEVRNITFVNNPEDAVGMEGNQSGGKITASVERCWIHNNEFYCPDITNPAESDKKQGDGSCDFKRGMYLTVAYNYFEGCHKTNLVGSSDSSLQYNLTYHHNYWYLCEARGPLARQANIHMYNNCFAGQIDYAMNTRANAYIFSESNLFYACKSPQAVESGAIKSFNDSISSYISKKGSLGTVVNNKTDIVANNCAYDGTDYSSFDTSAALSYIPGGEYALQEDLTQMRKELYAYAGVQKEDCIDPDDVSMDDISVIKKYGVTPEAIAVPVTGAFEKTFAKTKQMYAFILPAKCDVTVTYTGAPGVLVNEAGVKILEGSGTAHSLEKGNYAIQPVEIQPGNSASLTFATFKEIAGYSLSVTSADPNYDPSRLTGLGINKNTAHIIVDGTVALSATKEPSTAKTTGTLTWKSDDPSIASVSDTGIVTGCGIGTTVITATLDGVSATCNVTVSEPVKITGVVTDTESLNLVAGKSDIITAKVMPANTTEDYEISFSSDKPEVARVDNNGNVTGVSEGEAVITVTLVANPDYSGEGSALADTRSYTATVNVSVESAPALPQGAYTYNVTELGIQSNAAYTLAGNLKTKLDCTFGGLSLTQGIKMESKTQIDLNAGEKGTWIIITDPSAVGKKVKVGGTEYTVAKGEDNCGVVMHDVTTPGVYSIVKVDTNVNIMYMDLLTEGGSGDSDVAVSGVSITPDKVTLGVGRTAALTSQVEPENATNKKLNWSTSDPLVATVKDGVVTAVGAGKAVITARSVANADYSATCEVTVEAGIETVPVTGISLDTDKDFELGVGKVKTLKATVTPENATDKIVAWSSSNEGVAKVEDGVVTGISDGEAVITATAGDKSASVKVTVKSDSKEGDEPTDPSKPDDPVNPTVSMAKVPIYIGDKTYTLSYTKSYQYTGDKILLTDINIDGAKVGETIPGTQVTFAKIKYKNNKARGTASANIVLKANKGADKNLKNMVKFSNAVSKANPIAFEIIPRTLTADKVAGTAVYNAKKGKWKMKLTVDVGGKKPLKLKLNKKADKTDFGVDTAFAPQTDGAYPATVNITGVNNFNGTVPVSVTVK